MTKLEELLDLVYARIDCEKCPCKYDCIKYDEHTNCATVLKTEIEKEIKGE